MYRIVLSCEGIPDSAGPQAAIDVTEEFTHRPWHRNVSCSWNSENHALTLQAENDFDKAGLALLDEFSDAISASVENAGEGNMQIISVTEF